MNRIISLLFTIVLSSTISAQQESIKFRHLDDNNGLSNNSVLSVCQDYKGFMWFGTRYGLNRYDGHEFKIFNPVFNDTTSISSSHINKIFEDKQKNLWIATRNGLNRYNRDKDQFIRVKLEGDSIFTTNTYLTCITEDKNGNIWVAGPSGLSKIKNKKGKVTLSKSYKLIENRINRLFVDGTNKLWIACNTGLYLMNDENIKPFEIFISGKNITNILVNDICEIKNGDLLIGTENMGLIILNPNTHEAVNYKYLSNNKNSIINDRVRKVFEDDKGNIWIGTRYGLSIYNLANKNFINYSQNIIQQGSLSHNSVKDIYRDNSGGIWIATYAGGLNYFHPGNNMFKHVKEEFGIANTLSYNKVSYLYKDNSEVLWIGTEGRGFNSLDELKGTFKHYSNFDDHYEALDNIKSISEAIDDVLWIGTNGGLVKFDMKKESLKSFVHNPADTNSLSFNQIHTTLIDERGKLWIGTNGGGLDLFLPESNTFKHFQKNNNFESILSNNINYLLEAKDGKLWIGTESGLDCFNPVSQKFIRQDSTKQTKHIIPANKILVLYEDTDNYLWIGTEGNGLICLNKSDFSKNTYNLENGLANNVINAIEEDENKNIWISTNKGISKLSLNRNSSQIKLITVKNFYKTDGLQNNQFSYRSSLRDKMGKMYFGGFEGYNTFYPNQVKDTILTPTVVFTDFKINYKTVKLGEENSPIKKSISETKKIILQYFQRQFSLTFVGLNYINPDNVYYSYMLTGFDNQWVFTDKQRTISFTQLEAGTYDLRVRASDNPNIWGSKYSILKITVLPPPWKTWWAYLAYTIVALIIFASILFYINKWLILKNKFAFEKHSKEKEKELYQNKVRFFTDISHELRTPLTLIIGPLEKLISDVKLNYKLEKQLDIILHSAKKMHSLINQLMNLRKFEKGHIKLHASKGNISGFVKETTLPFREMAKLKGVKFEFLSSHNQVEAWYDRTKLEIVLNNLFSNALKATSHNGNIKVTLNITKETTDHSTSSSFVKIMVEDDGKGIAPEHIANIFDRFYQPDENSVGNQLGTGIGLELTMRMVKLHGGIIKVTSSKANENNKGFTVFTILIPLGKNHLKPENIIDKYRTSEDSSLYKNELLSSELIEGQQDVENFDLESLLDENKEKPLMMVVEDNLEVCNFIKSLFIENYRVKTAHNGKKGLQEIIKFIPDIIVSDIMMPEMDGIELCRLLKTDKRTCHIPVILLTARTELTFKYEGLETGADDYVQKPFSAKYLKMKVKNLLKQRKLMQEHFYRNSIVKPEELALSSMDENLINKAVQYIEKNINDPKLNVDNLSKELALSRVHFYRKIKSITNLTAVEFIRNIRLKKAAQLLEGRTYNIDEVKFMVGINDANYFRTSFKKQFGLNPKDYAKKKSFL
ncbi:MAG: hypothetical protein DRI95_15180 [Bacteroidetes bacterium]|nr:MAG: hypothetical protein DRI95_15180 [Bacteroidota bacterium]